MSKLTEKARGNAIIISLLLCVIGLIVMIWPGMSADIVGIVVGITLIVFGISRLISYYSKYAFRFMLRWDLFLGAASIVIGIILLTGPRGLMKLISIAIGIAVLIDGLSKLQIALAAKKAGLKNWMIIMLFAMLSIIVGIVLAANSSKGARTIMTVLGISLFIDGISGVIASSGISSDSVIDV